MMRVAPTTICDITVDPSMSKVQHSDVLDYRRLGGRVCSAWQSIDDWIDIDNNVVIDGDDRSGAPSKSVVGGRTEIEAGDVDQSNTTMTNVQPSTTIRQPCQCHLSGRQVRQPLSSLCRLRREYCRAYPIVSDSSVITTTRLLKSKRNPSNRELKL